MLVQAAGLALLAALSPTALLVAAVYLGTDRPRLIGAYYLTGAIIMTVVLGVIVLVALRAGGLSRVDHRTTRYGLRLGLGILLLIAGIVVSRRKPRQPDPARAGKGIMSRLLANPAPRSALIVGMLVFAPSLTFVAAVQVVATAHAGVALTVAGMATVIIIDVAFVWLPILAHLIAPDLTGRKLRAFNSWLRAHGHALLAGGLLVAGVIVTIDGVAGLTGLA